MAEEYGPGGILDEQGYRKIVETSFDGVVILDSEGLFVYTSPSVYRILGYEPADINGRHFGEFIIEEDLPGVAEAFTNLKNGNIVRNLVVSVVNKKGTATPVEVNATPQIEKGTVTGIHAIFRDITEREQALSMLRESEERFRILFEHAPDAYYMNDEDGNFIDGNRAAERIIGYPKEDLIGKSFLELGMLPEEYLQKAAYILAMNIEGRKTGPDEIQLIRKDGKKIWVEVMTHPIILEGRRTILGIARDITEKREAQQALVESQDKLKKTNDLLTMINRIMRHDLLNHLMIISLSMQNYNETKEGDFLNRIEKASKKSIELISRMKQLEHVASSEQKLRSWDVREVIEELSGMYPVKIDIKGKCNVMADEALHSVLENLIRNAVQHGNASRIRITLSDNETAPSIKIEDDGKGIEEELMKDIFREGFVHGKESGSGLGLFIVEQTMLRYGGVIEVRASEMGGALFELTFPKSDDI